MSEPSSHSELHLELLRQIEARSDSNQRDLAQRLGVSVGKINYCLRALISRGWVKVNNLRRSDNKLAYAYLLTPSGVLAKIKLTRGFLVQKEQEFERLQEEIAALRQEIDKQPPGGESSVPTPLTSEG